MAATDGGSRSPSMAEKRKASAQSVNDDTFDGDSVRGGTSGMLGWYAAPETLEGMARPTRPTRPDPSPTSRRDAVGPFGAGLLAVLLTAAGTLHFVIPRFYERIVPRVLPRPELLVDVSGLAEIAAGVLVALPRTRRLGAWAAAVLFVAVWPANFQHTADHFPPGDGEGWLSLLRLPLQLPLIAWAVRVARSS